MVKISDLSKKFKQNVVFAHLDLEIEDGELIHLAGINGSGKSTLFKMICGMPTSTETIMRNMFKSFARCLSWIFIPRHI